MFDDILLPTDGSECADIAMDHAEDLAIRYDARLHLLCVVDPRIIETGPDRDRIEDESTEIVENAHATVSEAGVTVERAIRTEVPHRAILQYVSDQEIDIVVMGTHGRTGVERHLLGSVTEKVVRLSDTPVLTVRESRDGATYVPYSDVLVPTDGSEGATAAIGPAVDISDTYDARIHALSVVDTMSLGFDVRSDAVLDALEDDAQRAVDYVVEQASRASLSTTEPSVEYGSPYRVIRSYVDEHDIDIVVMGTHGRSGIERYLLGSVTEKTVRTSPVPVLTVRSPTAA